MKLLALLLVCAVAAAAPKQEAPKIDIFNNIEIPNDTTPEGRNFLLNALIRQFFAILRLIINNGSSLLGLRPLDPLDMDHLHLYIPAGIINLDLELFNIYATGFGGFVVHRSNMNTRGDLTFDIDIRVPKLDIKAGRYILDGDLFNAIPIYGDGEATFVVEDFRFQAMLYLKQSDDGKSIIIDRIENVSFQLPTLKCGITGAIGGGDIDAIINAVIEDVVVDYVNRFQGAIGYVVSQLAANVANPILEQLDSWRYIAPFV